jgi:ActR/RegA family two-component response regulator
MTQEAAITMPPKLVLIDDDEVFSAIFCRWAQIEGISIDVFHSLDDMGFIGLLAQYDVAIVDYDLGRLNGVEVAEYMMQLFRDKPMVMISGTDRSREMLGCPPCVKTFMRKSAGYERILHAALKVRDTNLL